MDVANSTIHKKNQKVDSSEFGKINDFQISGLFDYNSFYLLEESKEIKVNSSAKNSMTNINRVEYTENEIKNLMCIYPDESSIISNPTENHDARFTIKLIPHSTQHASIYIFVDIVLKPTYPDSLPLFSTKKCSRIDNIREILKEARNVLKNDKDKTIFDAMEYIRDCLDKQADKIEEESKAKINKNSNEPKSQRPLSIDETKSMQIKEDSFNSKNIMISQEKALFEEEISEDQNLSLQFANFSNYSRFQNEFVLLEFLGSGGFSVCYKARNFMDNKFYAIKSCVIDPRDKETMKLIKTEVNLLSGLEHPNIIRYYSSWSERMNLDTAHSIFLDYFELDSYSYTAKSRMISDTKNNMNELIKSIEKKDKDNKEEGIQNNELESSNNSSDNESSSSKSEEDISFSDKYTFSSKRRNSDSPGFEEEKKNNKDYYVNIIFIQMEYCKELTLSDYIYKTNFLAKEEKWRILKEILEGMLYFHLFKIVHRDIKPANIFLDKKKRVKIGDFGIAYRQNSPQMNSSIKDQEQGKKKSLNSEITDKNDDSSSEELGTALYRSPEQEKKGVVHTCKSDIYSLGIVMYELWNPPFVTKMEKIRNLSDIKKENKLPQEFINNPENEMITYIINQCIKKNPEERPSAKQLLEKLPKRLDKSWLLEYEQILSIRNSERKDIVDKMIKTMSEESQKNKLAKIIYPDSNNYFIETIQQNKIGIEIYKSIIAIFEQKGAIKFEIPQYECNYEKNMAFIRHFQGSNKLLQSPILIKRLYKISQEFKTSNYDYNQEFTGSFFESSLKSIAEKYRIIEYCFEDEYITSQNQVFLSNNESVYNFQKNYLACWCQYISQLGIQKIIRYSEVKKKAIESVSKEFQFSDLAFDIVGQRCNSPIEEIINDAAVIEICYLIMEKNKGEKKYKILLNSSLILDAIFEQIPEQSRFLFYQKYRLYKHENLNFANFSIPGINANMLEKIISDLKKKLTSLNFEKDLQKLKGISNLFQEGIEYFETLFRLLTAKKINMEVLEIYFGLLPPSNLNFHSGLIFNATIISSNINSKKQFMNHMNHMNQMNSHSSEMNKILRIPICKGGRYDNSLLNFTNFYPMKSGVGFRLITKNLIKSALNKAETQNYKLPSLCSNCNVIINDTIMNHQQSSQFSFSNTEKQKIIEELINPNKVLLFEEIETLFKSLNIKYIIEHLNLHSFQALNNFCLINNIKFVINIKKVTDSYQLFLFDIFTKKETCKSLNEIADIISKASVQNKIVQKKKTK